MTYIDSKNEKLIKHFAEKHVKFLTDAATIPHVERWEEHYSDKSDDLFYAIKQLSQLMAKNQATKLPAKKLGKMLVEIAQEQQYDSFKKKIAATKARSEENVIKAILELLGDEYWDHKELIIRLMKEKFYVSSEKVIGKMFERAHEALKLEKFEKSVILKRKDKVTIETIDGMTGVEFEHFLRTYFEKEGYTVSDTPKTGDQGADLILRKLGEKICVQCKCYSGSIGNDAIQEVVGSLKYYSADKAIVVTNRDFTASAKRLAEANTVKLWDRTTLRQLLK